MFEDLVRIVGTTDTYEQIRISMVSEDDNKYSIIVSIDSEGLIRASRSRGMKTNPRFVAVPTIAHRETGWIEHVIRFRDSYTRHGRFILAPFELAKNESRFEPIQDIEILKTKIQFRHVSEIGRTDPDLLRYSTRAVECKLRFPIRRLCRYDLQRLQRRCIDWGSYSLRPPTNRKCRLAVYGSAFDKSLSCAAQHSMTIQNGPCFVKSPMPLSSSLPNSTDRTMSKCALRFHAPLRG